jgi:hypothetical protein
LLFLAFTFRYTSANIFDLGDYRELGETVGICPICSREEDWSHVLGCEGTKISREKIFNQRFGYISAGIVISSTVG